MLLNKEQIKEIIPHRDPFLFLDGILEIDREQKRVIAVKNITGKEPFFEGHFPGHPILPGVLIVEAMAQAAGVGVLREEQHKGKLAYFMSIIDAKFRKPVFPGSKLILEVQIVKERQKVMQGHGVAKVNDEVVAEADLMFAIIENKNG